MGWGQAGVVRWCGMVCPCGRVQHVAGVAVVVEVFDVVCFLDNIFQGSRNQAGKYLPWLTEWLLYPVKERKH